MVTIIFKHPDGEETRVDSPVGETVMRVAVEAGIPGIVGDCGGNLSCATCHCYVDPAWGSSLPNMSADEETMLESALDVTLESRLSCQIVVTAELEGIRLMIPESSL
ncbi:ferredoxin [Novosphingobium endophyticum]|uniref:Ferredoxin n=1 Tax=Novosphingobium endophyticum TaxID=1955250 RepID=A0A916X6F6_9SPHN|nr:2Fe-2S iron-sulfur cluster-binding protein [Novosphingobium endophyticum]GGC15907.1 ferredoxin [Novosphingobium endophyticum]